jgi:hypothetical protein
MSELTYEIISRRLTDIQRDRAQDSKALGMRGWRERERKKGLTALIHWHHAHPQGLSVALQVVAQPVEVRGAGILDLSPHQAREPHVIQLGLPRDLLPVHPGELCDCFIFGHDSA